MFLNMTVSCCFLDKARYIYFFWLCIKINAYPFCPPRLTFSFCNLLNVTIALFLSLRIFYSLAKLVL
ncbi:hypothetical protein PRUPE_6G233000 [Prunus persica]|uniref:Uncharacterized protein n=1 Tax=Prunus persica TaxID=3760 RepID=A0A251NUM5_PRUPE|nr:hypothetical protein PRUPE_6G233000 [Prunus persica]